MEASAAVEVSVPLPDLAVAAVGLSIETPTNAAESAAADVPPTLIIALLQVTVFVMGLALIGVVMAELVTPDFPSAPDMDARRRQSTRSRSIRRPNTPAPFRRGMVLDGIHERHRISWPEGSPRGAVGEARPDTTRRTDRADSRSFAG
jgi:hypothetical protein